MPKIKISKKANDVIRKDKSLFVTTTRESYPFVAEKGDGDFAYDISGNKFIDFSSFISVYNFGVNANSKVREAIKAQVDKLMHSAFTDYYAELPVKFAEEFTGMFPKQYGKLFLSNSGTEANEAAIKFSKAITKRSSIIIINSLRCSCFYTFAAPISGPWPSLACQACLHFPFPLRRSTSSCIPLLPTIMQNCP